MPQRPHIARYLRGNRSYVNDYPAPATTVPVRIKDWVRLNASNIIEVVTGVDPTNILGIAISANVSPARMPSAQVIEPTRILVDHFSDDSVAMMDGTRAPLTTDENKDYGISLAADGSWVVNLANITTARVRVVDVDLTRGKFFCILLAAHRQMTPMGA